MIAVKKVGDIVTVEFGKIRHLAKSRTIIQAIGKVIGGKHNHGIIRNAKLLKSANHIGEGILKFQIACVIAFDAVGIFKVLNSVPVFHRHRVGTVVIAVVSADRHIVNIEVFRIFIHGHGALNHFQIALRPLPFHIVFHAVAISHEAMRIAQAVMGEMTVIECIGVVMEGPAFITEPVELAAHGHIIVAVRHILERSSAVGRHHAEDDLIFPTGSAGTGRLIIIGKINTFVNQPVKGGSQLFGNHFV